jgi:dUTP pyrophosphatase
LQSNSPRIEVARLPHAADLPMPSYMSRDAAGADVAAAVAEELVLAPGARALVPTGLVVAIPAGYEIQIRPRSGLAFKHGVTVLNAPGTIDADYRGEIGVLLVNHGSAPFTIRRGDRIAQMVVAAVPQAVFAGVAVVGATARHDGGFGSTGT